MRKLLSFIILTILFLSVPGWAFPPVMPGTSLPSTCTDGQIVTWNATTRAWDTCAAAGGAASISDTAYDATSWNGVVDVAPSKNAVRDKLETITAPSDTAYGSSWDGVTTIAPSKNAVYDQMELRAKKVEYFVSDYGTLQAAISAIGATVGTLVLDAPITQTANVTVPATLSIQAMKGGIISHGAYTITINGNFDAGLYQVFNGTGAVALNGISRGYPEWFGTVAGTGSEAAGINKALVALFGKEVLLGYGNYVIEATINIPTNTSLIGSGMYDSSIIVPNAAAYTGITVADSAVNVQIKNLTVWYNNDTTPANKGIDMGSGGTYSIIRDVRVSRFETGVYLTNQDSFMIDNLKTSAVKYGVYSVGGSVNNSISNSQIMANGVADSAVIYLDGTSTSGEGWMIFNTLLYSADYGVYSINYSNMYLSTMIFDGIYKYGVYATGTGGGSVSSNWAISGSYFGIVGTATAGFASVGTGVNSGTVGHKIVNNHFVVQLGATCNYGIYIPSTATEARYSHISGNSFFGYNTGGGFALADIYVDRTDCIVRDNKTLSTISRPLHIASGGDTLRLLETGTTPTYSTIFQSGDLTGADLTITTPPAYPAGNDYLVKMSTAGVMGYTDPATLGGGGGGDITDVGDCSSGNCLDGSSDGGTYIRLYDGTSAYSAITAGVRTLTLAPSNANAENLVVTFGDNSNVVALSSGTGAVVNISGSSASTTGNAATATALAADPANCTAGQIALGITAAGVAECTATPSGLTSVGATTFTGALTGNASTATLAGTVTVVDSTSATTWVGLYDSATGSLAPKTDGGLTYAATTGILTAAGFAGPLTGAVTGNASTATLAGTVTVVDSGADSTTWPLLVGTVTGSLAPVTDPGLTYDASTNALTATTFVGALTGNASGTAGGLSGTPNVTVGTISAGAAGFTVDADGDVVAKGITVTPGATGGVMTLYEGSGGGTNFRAISVPNALTADVDLQHADALPAANQFQLYPAPTTGVSQYTWTTYGAFGALNLTTSGSIGATGARILKGWFTDIESTNPPTINGGTLAAGALLTGYSSGAGTVAGTDTILQAVNKLNGNTAAKIGGTYGATANTIGKRGADASTVAASGITEDGTTISAGALNLVTTGTISGGIPSTTDNNGQTLSAAQQYGYMHWATGAGTTNLVTAVAGMNFCLYSTTAAAVVINPANADIILLNGTALSAGDSITSASGAGDFICLVSHEATKWVTLGRSGTWTDTN